MALLDILEYPDPRLRMRSIPVTRFDDSVLRLADDLLETLDASGAIGLSAPQANDHREVLVIDLSDDASAPEIFVNPRILASGAIGLVQESCLSVPGVVGNIVRATQVRVRAQTARGDTFERELDGMEAVCLQHEMDHLAGKLFVDRLSLFRRLRIRAAAAARARRGARATA